MTIPENWVFFVVGGIIGLLQYVFTQMVVRRIDRLDKKMELSETANNLAHKELWVELHRIDKETSNRISSIETRCDIESNIKKLLSTT